jgi:ArsR family transcriptional regulator
VQRLLRLLSDPTRLRILAAVEPEELAVNEIADVLGMGQSRISNHLRLLREAGALHGRRDGAWTFYRNALDQEPETAALWLAVRQGLARDPALKRDAKRRRAVLERRRRRSREHFAAGNGRAGFEHGTLREEIVAALAPAQLVAVDAGCGDGFLTEELAARFSRVLAFDHSPQRLTAARRRVPDRNVTFQRGEVDALPLAEKSADAVFFSMVLHHVPEIGAALREAWRILRPKGRVVVADLAPHGDETLRERMGDLRLGLDREELDQALKGASFANVRILPVRDRLVVGRQPMDLFIATGERLAATRRKRKRTSRQRRLK